MQQNLKRKADAIPAATPTKRHAPPKNGSRPIIPMQLSWRDQEETTILALLDTGATCALISTKFVEQYGAPSETREVPLSISTFDGATLPDAGKRYTHPLRLRHGEHVTMEAFEISRLEESSEIILPHWWMIDHPPIGLLEGKTISFASSRCRTRCTQYALNTFPIQYDDEIIASAASIASIGCLGHIRATSDGYAIDWNLLHVGEQRIVGAAVITPESVAALENRLPAEYRDYASVFEPQLADALPPHREFDHAIDLQE